MNEIIGLTSGVVGLIGYVPYVRDILKHQTKPERTSWLIWTLEYTVLCAAQLAKGAGPAIWLAGLQLAGVIVVYCLSLKFGVGRIDRRNKILLACTCGALGAWFITSNAAAAICILIAVEGSGVALTTLKVYRQPDSETLTMWLLLSIAGAVGIFAIPTGSDFALYIYPVFLTCVGLVVTCASRLGARKSAFVPLAEDLV